MEKKIKSAIKKDLSLVNQYLDAGDIENTLNLYIKLKSKKNLHSNRIVQINNVKIKLLLEIDKNKDALFYCNSIDSDLPNNYNNEILSFMLLHAAVFLRNNKVHEANQQIKLVNKIINESNNTSHDQINGELFNLEGLIFKGRYELDKALVKFEKSLTEFERQNNVNKIARTYYNLGITYFLQTDYSKSMSNLIYALEAYEEINYVKGKHRTLLALKDIYQQMDEPEKISENKTKIDNLITDLKSRENSIISVYQLLQANEDQIDQNLKKSIEKREPLGINLEEDKLSKIVDEQTHKSKNDEAANIDPVDMFRAVEENKYEFDNSKLTNELIKQQGIEMSHVNKQVQELNTLVNKILQGNNQFEIDLNKKFDKLLTANEAVISKIHDEISNLNTKISESLQSQDGFENTVKSKFEELLKLNQNASQYQEDTNKHVQELNTLVNKILQGKDQFEIDLKDKFDKLLPANEELISKIHAEISNLDTKMGESLQSQDGFENTVKSKFEELLKLNQNVSQYQEDIKKLKSTNENLNEKIAKKEEDIKSLQNLSNEIDTKFKGKITVLEQQIDELTKIKNDFENEIQHHKSNILLKDEENTKLITENKLLKEEVDKYKNLAQETKQTPDSQPAVRKYELTKIEPDALLDELKVSKEPNSLEDIIRSHALAEKLINILQKDKRIKMIILAMKLQSTPSECMKIIPDLEKLGFIHLVYQTDVDTNPTIILN